MARRRRPVPLRSVTSQRRDGRSTRWDPHRRERRQRIIAAAIEAIEEHGPDALTAQIAERAGVPRTHVYRHFDGKPALDLAVSRAAARQLSEHFVAAMTSSGTTREIVRALIEPFLAWVEEHPNLYRFLTQHSFTVSNTGTREADDAKSVLANQLTLMTTAYAALLGVEPASTGRPVAAMVGLVDSSAVWWLEHGGQTRSELADELTVEVLLLVVRTAGQMGIDLDPDAELPQLIAD
jgi:AcrR family transcriptional regulator